MSQVLLEPSQKPRKKTLSTQLYQQPLFQILFLKKSLSHFDGKSRKSAMVSLPSIMLISPLLQTNKQTKKPPFSIKNFYHVVPSPSTFLKESPSQNFIKATLMENRGSVVALHSKPIDDHIDITYFFFTFCNLLLIGQN